MKRHQFTRSYTNRDKLPFDAPRLALALRYLYDEFAAKPDRPALPMHTQIPDFPKPPNPVLYREPSQAPLGAPIQVYQDRMRASEQENEKLKWEVVKMKETMSAMEQKTD